MRTLWLLLIPLALLLSVGGLARADFEEGRAAYKAGDFEGAMAAWKPLAEFGDRTAQLWLGSMYENGKGVDRDLVEARKWYVLAGDRKVAQGRRRAKALQATLTPEQLEDSRERVRAWKEAFETVREPAAGPERADIEAFHAKATAHTVSHPNNASLRTLCVHKTKHDGGEGYITFVTDDREHVLLVSLTDRPIQAARKDISLDVVMMDRRSPGRSTATMDWAYVYDRNRDGRVDYLTYLIGPGSVLPERAPKELLGSPGGIMNGKQMLFRMKNMRQVFWHVADDDMDGSVDGYLVPTMDQRMDWIDGEMLVRSSAFDDRFDKCRFLPGTAAVPGTSCQRSTIGYGVRGREIMGLSRVPIPEDIDIFRAINEAARACGLTSRRFRAE